MRLMVLTRGSEERIGEQSAAALTDMFTAHADYVLVQCTERFERRLVEEASKLRVGIARLRSDLRGEMAFGRVEPLNWAFMFWIGHVVSVVGLVALLLRARG